jgi:hypothetical protein
VRRTERGAVDERNALTLQEHLQFVLVTGNGHANLLVPHRKRNSIAVADALSQFLVCNEASLRLVLVLVVSSVRFRRFAALCRTKTQRADGFLAQHAHQTESIVLGYLVDDSRDVERAPFWQQVGEKPMHDARLGLLRGERDVRRKRKRSVPLPPRIFITEAVAVVAAFERELANCPAFGGYLKKVLHYDFSAG